VDTVFLQEKKQYSSAQGVITIRKVGIVRGDSRITISEEVIDSLDDTSIWKLKIYCHFLHFAKTEDIGLKCCMGARFLKTRSTGRSQEDYDSIGAFCRPWRRDSRSNDLE
jgi:hypothetical protein